MSSEYKKIYKAIDEILWNDWDPIGVNNFKEARDEYYGYVPAIFGLKIGGANKETIAEKLHEIETYRMGIIRSINYCQQIAEKIIELK
ncbi:MAG TPA: hypothetical protein VKG26_15175 [Bacteroidia bacterium]|nr:hypothetical protein [Bacteroidia bacterium]